MPQSPAKELGSGRGNRSTPSRTSRIWLPVLFQYIHYIAVTSIGTHHPEPATIGILGASGVPRRCIDRRSLPIRLHAFVVIEVPQERSVDAGLTSGAENGLCAPGGPADELVLIQAV